MADVPGGRRAAIFDLDGLLIDSEPIWRRVEIDAFADAGIGLTEEMCATTMGWRLDAVVDHWARRFGLAEHVRDGLAREIVERMAAEVAATGEAMPGASGAAARLHDRGLTIAVCSSSPRPVIAAALDRLGLPVPVTAVHSAFDEEYGKPHPACYLTTAALLGVAPSACLALEDSPAGAIAAAAAKMAVVAVPDPSFHAPGVFAFCDAVVSGLDDVDGAVLDALLEPVAGPYGEPIRSHPTPPTAPAGGAG